MIERAKIRMWQGFDKGMKFVIFRGPGPPLAETQYRQGFAVYQFRNLYSKGFGKMLNGC
jgi:hypothetical protein